MTQITHANIEVRIMILVFTLFISFYANLHRDI